LTSQVSARDSGRVKQILLALALLVTPAGCDDPVPEESQLSLSPVGRPPPPHPLINYGPSNLSIDITDINTISPINSISITIGPVCTCPNGLSDCITPDAQHYARCISCLCSYPACGPGLANCDYGTPNGSCETATPSDTACGLENGGAGPKCYDCTKTSQHCSIYNSTNYACCGSGYINCSGNCQLPNGSCGCTSCTGSTTCCTGACVDISSSAVDCGACGNVCSTTNVVTGTECVSGQCNGTCVAGFKDCLGTIATTGCQTNINTDLANCGGCTHACPVPANGTATCTTGVCGIVCNDNYKPCNGQCIPTSGCCLDTECTSPPDDCRVQQGTCTANTCVYRQITCPTVDCKNPPTCNKGTCVYSALPVGTSCAASGCFTAGDAGPPTCQLDSNANIYCNGVPKDCSAFDGVCTKGVCDSSNGQCNGSPINEAMSCASDLCQVSPICTGGVCTGTPKSCPSPPPCHIGYCDSATGDCKSDRIVTQPIPCEIDECHFAAQCDRAGECIGSPRQDGTPCTAPSSCATTASCAGGACTCDSAIDASVPQLPDMSTPKPKPKGKGCNGGCGAGGSPAPSVAWILLFLGVVAWRLRRRRQG
jgi:uncharacterized protein (TIGR03382 family)